MIKLFTLASDFIERMSNPAYGVVVNEDYAMRFAELLHSNSRFEATLKREAKSLTNTDVLTAHGWMWLLGWARSQRVALSEELLLEITDKWKIVSMQSLAIEVATQTARWKRLQSTPSLEEFEHPFLKKLLLRAVQLTKDQFGKDTISYNSLNSEEIRTDRAESILVALLDVESVITLDAAAALLNYRWKGQRNLRVFYEHLHAGLGPEPQKEWDKRLYLL